MAKRIMPFNSADTPKAFKKAVFSYKLGDQIIARMATTLPPMTPELMAVFRQLYKNADDSWKGLKTWKKARWTLCAIATWGDITNKKGKSGYSGYSLYIQCWLEQQPQPGKQPISPCSQRVTNPDASPWNYQP